MFQVNFFGDFKCDNVIGLSMDEALSTIIKRADFNVINFEAPVIKEGFTPVEKDGPNHHQHQKCPGFLVENGFNIISLANNHAMDYGEEGLTYTQSLFPKCSTLGAGSWDEAYQPLIKDIDGKKLAFLALTQHEYGTLYEESYQAFEKGTAWMQHPKVDEIIIKSKSECDYLFLIVHAGYEYEYYPLPELVTLYHHFIDIGADGIIASHPHIVQPFEKYKGKPIAYSLGNFFFDKKNANKPFWHMSMFVTITCNQTYIDATYHFCQFDSTNRKILLRLDDKIFDNYFNNIMQVFQHKEDYLANVKAYCQAHETGYLRNMCAYSVEYVSWFVLIKLLIKRLLRLNNSTMPSVKNATLCEAHRWCMHTVFNSKNTNDR